MSEAVYGLSLLGTIAILAVSGALKLVAPAEARKGLEELGLPRLLRTRGFATGWPLVELLLAIALMLVPAPLTSAVSAAVLLVFTLFLAIIIRAVRTGRRAACHCFGAHDRAPVSTATVVRNTAFVLLATVVLIGSPRGSSLQTLSRLDGDAAFQVGVLLILAAGAIGLMRTLGPVERTASDDAVGRHLLTDLFGVQHDARGWHGGDRSLVFFVSSTCAACHAFGEDIARWIPELEAAGVRTRVVTDVPASSAINSFPALGSRIYHDVDGGLTDRIGVVSYPAAALLDGESEARILSAPAAGAEQVRRLVDRVLVGAPS